MSSAPSRKTGRVKFFNSQKGYGFIIQDEDPNDINNKAEDLDCENWKASFLPTPTKIDNPNIVKRAFNFHLPILCCASTFSISISICFFVHHTAIHNDGGFKSLAEVQFLISLFFISTYLRFPLIGSIYIAINLTLTIYRVEFDLIRGDKGLQAAHVSGPNGRSVKGDPNAPRRPLVASTFGIGNGYPIPNFGPVNGTLGGYNSGMSMNQQPYHMQAAAFAAQPPLGATFPPQQSFAQYGNYGYLPAPQPNGNSNNGGAGNVGLATHPPFTSAAQNSFPPIFPQYTGGNHNDGSRNANHINNGTSLDKFGISNTGMFGSGGYGGAPR
ncbi:hypothetical protein G9A89_013494 [Geosiphon pyriformis]|nr:hypothetical protein G9A89_013494 [Geosiphon pyriformis]